MCVLDHCVPGRGVQQTVRPSPRDTYPGETSKSLRRLRTLIDAFKPRFVLLQEQREQIHIHLQSQSHGIVFLSVTLPLHPHVTSLSHRRLFHSKRIHSLAIHQIRHNLPPQDLILLSFAPNAHTLPIGIHEHSLQRRGSLWVSTIDTPSFPHRMATRHTNTWCRYPRTSRLQ